MVLEAIRYRRGSLQILNQLKLPHIEEYDAIHDSKDAWQAIKAMRTRGAPAIAIVAALSLAVELNSAVIEPTAGDTAAFIYDRLDYLVTSRPTAVNLADAVKKLKAVVDAEVARVKADGSGDRIREVYIAAAEKMLIDDVRDNEAIGRYGAEWIGKNTGHGREGQVSVLTHCNTG